MIANDDHPIPAWMYEKFTQAQINYRYHQCYCRRDLEQCAGEADLLWLMSSRKGLVIEEHMDIFKRAGAVLKCGSGTDNIDHAACTKRGIIVAHTPEDATEPTSDHTVAMLLTAARQTARQDRLVRNGVWDFRAALPAVKLRGAKLGVIGFGRIGRMTIKKLAGFQMEVRVFDPFVTADEIAQANCRKAELKELITKSQMVLVCCPLMPETRDLLGEKELAWMQPEAILVNCARAGIVNEKALAKVLRENRIKGAALDVLERHPVTPDHPFYGLENVTFTPHLAGTPADYPDSLFKTVVEVIIGLSKMKKPKWIANKGVVPKWNLTD